MFSFQFKWLEAKGAEYESVCSRALLHISMIILLIHKKFMPDINEQDSCILTYLPVGPYGGRIMLMSEKAS